MVNTSPAIFSGHRRLAPWSVSLSLLFLGCGKGDLATYPVTGKVTFADGTPMTGGLVTFSAQQAGKSIGARGPIQQDGTFTMGTFQPGDGAAAGEQRVSVVPPLPKVDRDEVKRLPPPPIDPKFGRFETSGLTHTVTRKAADNFLEIIVEPPK